MYGALSCRDYYSVKTLNINGYDNSIMTGCPAWYNLEYIDKLDVKEIKHVKKICISDPAQSENIYHAYDLAKYMKERFKDAKIYFVFHRIEKEKNKYNELIEALKKLEVEICDITGSAEGFKIYDDCDLHIGFRVHAHIYNLSNRNISILIEEDGRGAGVNDALGIAHLLAYTQNNYSTYKSGIFAKGIRFFERIILHSGKYKCNKYLIEDVRIYLDTIFHNNFSQYKTAYFNMNMYFEEMKKHIENIIKE